MAESGRESASRSSARNRAKHGRNTCAIASERHAYTLTDRATFTQLAHSLTLQPFLQHDPDLINTYAVIVPDGLPANPSHATHDVAQRRRRSRPHRAIHDGRHSPFIVWPADRCARSRRSAAVAAMSLLDSIGEAVTLIARGDAEVWHVTGVSLQVSVLPCCWRSSRTAGGVCRSPPRRRPVRILGSWILHTLTGLPTVVVGLTLYFAFSAAGPLGWMDLLTRVPQWSSASSSWRCHSRRDCADGRQKPPARGA